MMNILTILLTSIAVGLGGSSEEPTLAELVEMLGSDRPAVRAEAARTLEESGADALPALEAVRASEDPAIRQAVAELLDRIEAPILKQPTMVTLDFEDRPLAEVVESLAEQTSFSIELEPEDDAEALQERPIHLVEPEPVPFWEALDRLGRAGKVRQNPTDPTDPPAGLPKIRLVDGAPANPNLRSNSGAFQVHLLHLDYESLADVPSSPDAEFSEPRRTLYATLQLFAEPRLLLEARGMSKILALNDQGQPFPPPPSDAERSVPESRGWVRPGVQQILQYRMPLGVPDDPPAQIQTLKGSIPAQILSRRSDPLEISLDADANDNPDTPVQKGGLSIRLEQFDRNPGLTSQLVLVLKAEDGRDPADSTQPLQHRVEVLDREDRSLPWLGNFEGRTESGEARLRIRVASGPGPGITSIPARLRFYELSQAEVEVPFEFQGVPWP